MTRLCRLYHVTRSGFYAWRDRPTSAHARQDRVLLEDIRAIFEHSGGTYGRPRLYRARVVRVYRRTAGTHRWFDQHPNRVQRTQASGINQIGVGDLTYLAVAGRWWSLAAILDQHSRRVLSGRLAATRDALCTRALVHAALRRRQPTPGLIFHSDRGSAFLGTPFRQRLAASGVQQRMTRGGAPDENAHRESFFHSLKAELTHGRTFTTVAELRHALRR